MSHRYLAGIAFAIVFASVAAASRGPFEQPTPDITGLWGSETTFGPQVRGDLTLERLGESWTLRIGGFEVAAPAGGDSLRLALPGGQGELRAWLDPGGSDIRAYWVQPAGNLGSFATPVALERTRAGAWRGIVGPLDERFSLYLHVVRQQDGTLKGVFHNPEMNWNGRAPWFRVAVEGDTVALVDPSSGKKRFVQPFDADRRQISMDFGGPVVLSPRARDQAIGFYPRTPASARYTYREPLASDDGWVTARAADAGLDESILESAVETILRTDPLGDNAPRMHALLVARHGKLVLDEYFFGFSQSRPHDLRSASKTLTSVLAGVAMDRGAPFTTDTPAWSVLPRDAAGGAPDARKQAVTVGQLLTHSSGLACDDNDSSSPGNEDTMQQQTKVDWYRYTRDLPMAHDPGTTYAYCSGGINLVGAIVRETTGAWLPDYFDRYIARPMDIRRYHMNLMPSGEAYAGGGIRMTPRNFLKFGQMYLDGGVWKGRQIVSRAWVKRSTSRQIAGPNGSTDGFGWHRYTLTSGGRTYQEYEASGNGGQFLMVLPDLDLVVVMTGGSYGQYGVWRTFREEFVPSFILPSAAPRK
ncbi:MAG: beta-lactamase family protein [Vicinamibacterales bacterium]|jgi:CubicO group peptidase (beta-lactamase class C family)|nr:beta-lactamase family protein [Vicinamibacterales bacterium]